MVLHARVVASTRFVSPRLDDGQAYVSCGLRPTSCPCGVFGAGATAPASALRACVSMSFAPCRSPPSPRATVVVGAESSFCAEPASAALPSAPLAGAAVFGAAAAAAPPPQASSDAHATSKGAQETVIRERVQRVPMAPRYQSFGPNIASRSAGAVLDGTPGRVLRLGEHRVSIAPTPPAPVAEPAAPGPRPERLGAYEVLAELAAGGMATVHLARATDKRQGPPLVAIKRPHRHLGNDRMFVTMLVDEARLASAIEHPNVVKVRELGFEGELPFIVMDYVEGASLAEVAQGAGGAGSRNRRPGRRGASRSTPWRGSTPPTSFATRRDDRCKSSTATSPRTTSSSAATAARASPTSASPRPKTACRRRGRTR